MTKYIENKITVYTPTYNRGYCLHQLYDSLCKQLQQNRDFEWLIVDDGSTDDTEHLVQKWMKIAPFKIIFYKQENEGKMAKLNFIHQIIETELCVCVDSDDYLTDNALDEIFKVWRVVKGNSQIGGLVGLDVFKNGNVVGTEFPEGLSSIKFRDFERRGVKGDKKFIYRTSVISSYPPYPSFKGEKFPAPGYLYRLIDLDYDLWIINKPLCIVEYLEDGLSKNKFSQFKKAPNSFMFYRQERMRLATSFSERFKNAIHYVSSGIFTKKNVFKNNKYPITTFFAVPLGVLLNIYLNKTSKKGAV
ncbi:glycosyltransferase family A protein [Flavobacterium sp. NKUCC04_CG]|uniref:glycosyltransferase family 2 protein n=1 Tax=Flavobacterium sp. NKUCC04_CG TaxID=2842121 RepID=UPI001C5B7C1F|nr:glycosyltransferase family A protein [Flavobacterium sp. NKUCC04_CG]MBW3517563.1 glycosyltransferase family 2 protein [Flavobacterium sp. NKUCC04_CG]